MWFGYCHNCNNSDFTRNTPYCNDRKMSCAEVVSCTSSRILRDGMNNAKHARHVRRLKLNKMGIRGRHYD